MIPANAHPGEILLENYLKPMGISQNAMARAIGVPPRAVNEIVLGRRAITPAMSIRFGAFFGQPENFWSTIQMDADFHALADDRNRLIVQIRTASDLTAERPPGASTGTTHEEPGFFQLPVENL